MDAVVVDGAAALPYRRGMVLTDVRTETAPQVPEGYSTRSTMSHGFEASIGPLYVRRGGPGPNALGFRIEKRHVNGRDACHGGMLVTLADMAWGQQLYGLYDAGWATVRLTTDFLSNASIGAWVEASSEVLRRDGDLWTVRGRIWSGERTLMTGTAIYKGLNRQA
jgi:acyl-coenzyme A thioesterase PaaI-like protein